MERVWLVDGLFLQSICDGVGAIGGPRDVGPLQPHIVSDMGPLGAHITSDLGLPSDMGPPPPRPWLCKWASEVRCSGEVMI